ncbi:response regulator [Candidatus Nitronereus thalassa]|uniref:Response regulator n=1 Tax=Candidatus Nitronereus thalassa TaxID=3020898 RepID=A0ABU3K836_9BACT|nr:response regulator [Candidatus Nitronereus thalassa]MDT7042559.1 response regulator [Candidatus Nitronereus thalassa]
MDSPKTVLVAVSDVFFYTKIRDAFKPAGFTLQRIKSETDVEAKAIELHPVAIVLDMNDPRLNGKQALQTLKGHPELKHIPVLAFANHEEVDTWRAAKELGIDKIVSRNEFSSRTLALLEEVTKQVSS